MELCAHRDCTFTDDLTAPAPPCLLNYWRSSHYGGAICNIAKGEDWTKVIGPFLIYCDSADTHDAVCGKTPCSVPYKESKAWPYDWVQGVDYPHQNERGIVDGQLVLNDPQSPNLQPGNLLVGLSAPAYVAPATYNNRYRNFRFNNDGETNNSPFPSPQIWPAASGLAK